MGSSKVWTRILLIAGFAGMLVGVIDPLEGSFVILPSACLLATGAWIGASRYRAILSWSAAAIAIGVVAMIVLSEWGGIGGDGGASLWWGVFILPYPVGWLTSIVSAVLALAESWKTDPTSALRKIAAK